MRTVSLRLAATALTVGLSACAIPFEVRVLAVHPDFSTPEAAGESFLAAVSVDEGVAEYRCFSLAMKESYGATLDAYLLARAEFREEYGAVLGLAHRLDHLESRPVPEGVETVWGTGGGPRLVLVMERQHFVQFYGPDPEPVGEFLDEAFPDLLSFEGRRVLFDAPLENRAIRAAVERWKPGEFHRFEAGSEWKILRIEDPSAPPQT